jgi:hypothetical protein
MNKPKKPKQTTYTTGKIYDPVSPIPLEVTLTRRLNKKIAAAQVYDRKTNRLQKIQLYITKVLDYTLLNLNVEADLVHFTDLMHYDYLCEFVCYHINLNYGIHSSDRAKCDQCFPFKFTGIAMDWDRDIIEQNDQWAFSHGNLTVKSNKYDRLATWWYYLKYES